MTSTDLPVRSRTVNRDAPTATAVARLGAVGPAFLQPLVDGEVPGLPIASLLGMSLVSVLSDESM